MVNLTKQRERESVQHIEKISGESDDNQFRLLVRIVRIKRLQYHQTMELSIVPDDRKN